MALAAMTRVAFVATLSVLLCAPLSAVTPQGQVTQAQLADKILTAPLSEKLLALSDVFSIPADRREPVLEQALIKELGRLNEDDRNRWRATREGKPFQPEADTQAEYRVGVARVLLESPNPAVIPVLVGALGSVNGLGRALVRFGDAAAAPLVAAARAAHPNYAAPTEALGALRLLVESGKPISEKSAAQIVAVAGERMNGPQYFGHVIAAIDLAIATNSDQLRGRVTQLSQDSFQVRQLGITDVGQAQRVRDAAAAALKRN